MGESPWDLRAAQRTAQKRVAVLSIPAAGGSWLGAEIAVLAGSSAPFPAAGQKRLSEDFSRMPPGSGVATCACSQACAGGSGLWGEQGSPLTPQHLQPALLGCSPLAL